MDKNNLLTIENKILKFLKTDIKQRFIDARQAIGIVLENAEALIEQDELYDPIVDIDEIESNLRVGEMLEELLLELLPGSLVVERDTFSRQIFCKMKNHQYIWVVAPLDGRKAFRDLENTEYSVGIALLMDLDPIFSVVYAPELKTDYGKGTCVSANKYVDGVCANGKEIFDKAVGKPQMFTSHIDKDHARNRVESQIARMFKKSETIFAHDGHSTLVQYMFVALNINEKSFSRRDANVWDVAAGGYLVIKNNGSVFYPYRSNIFPIDIDLLTFSRNHLFMPLNVACNKPTRDMICKVFVPGM